jgi:hypothetical protein
LGFDILCVASDMGNELYLGWTRMLPGTRARSARRAVETDGVGVGGTMGVIP